MCGGSVGPWAHEVEALAAGRTRNLAPAWWRSPACPRPVFVDAQAFCFPGSVALRLLSASAPLPAPPPPTQPVVSFICPSRVFGNVASCAFPLLRSSSRMTQVGITRGGRGWNPRGRPPPTPQPQPRAWFHLSFQLFGNFGLVISISSSCNPVGG